MTDWIAHVQLEGRNAFWLGTFKADGREDAKRACVLGASAAVGGRGFRMLRIAKGRVNVQLDGEVVEIDPPVELPA